LLYPNREDDTLINKIKDIVYNNIEDIYLIGLLDLDDKEFITNNNYVFFEFTKGFIEIEAIEGYGKLKMSITDSIETKNWVDDVIEGKARISDFVFTNPLSANKRIKAITFYNLHIEDDALISDILLLELIDGQTIFIDPGFLGINLGGVEQKEYWKEHKQNFDSKKIKKIAIMTT